MPNDEIVDNETVEAYFASLQKGCVYRTTENEQEKEAETRIVCDTGTP